MVIVIKVTTTREIIEKLEVYEKENGVGIVKSIATVCGSSKNLEYSFRIANDSDYNRVFHPEDYKETSVDIFAVDDNNIFQKKDKEEDLESLQPDLD